MTITRIGFAGVGHMGSAMAEAMVRNGCDVMVYDLRPEALERLAERGARIARSPAELSGHAQLLCVAIAGDAALESALIGADGLIDGLSPHSIVAIHTTAHPSAVERIAAYAAPRDVSVIDAPVSGGRTASEAGNLCFMVGGDAGVVSRCSPVFSAFGTVFHMGPLGSGTVTKIAQQMMTTLTIVGVDEGTRLADAYGVDLRRFMDVVRATTAQSHVADFWIDGLRKIGPPMANSFYTSLNPAVDLAGNLSVDVPGTALAQQLIRRIFAPPPA